MKKPIHNAYKIVIRDLRENIDKCKEYNPLCGQCLMNRLADDLEYFYEMFKEDFEFSYKTKDRPDLHKHAKSLFKKK